MASTNNITISSTNNITINGTSNYIISSNYGCISLIRKNNSWWITSNSSTSGTKTTVSYDFFNSLGNLITNSIPDIGNPPDRIYTDETIYNDIIECVGGTASYLKLKEDIQNDPKIYVNDKNSLYDGYFTNAYVNGELLYFTFIYTSYWFGNGDKHIYYEFSIDDSNNQVEIYLVTNFLCAASSLPTDRNNYYFDNLGNIKDIRLLKNNTKRYFFNDSFEMTNIVNTNEQIYSFTASNAVTSLSFTYSFTKKDILSTYNDVYSLYLGINNQNNDPKIPLHIAANLSLYNDANNLIQDLGSSNISYNTSHGNTRKIDITPNIDNIFPRFIDTVVNPNDKLVLNIGFHCDGTQSINIKLGGTDDQNDEVTYLEYIERDIKSNNIIGLLGDNFMKQDEINDILLPTISFNIVPASKSIYTWSSTNEWRDIFYIIPANLDGMEISKMYTSYGDAWPATSSRVFNTQLRDSLNHIAGASLMWEHPSSSRIYATFSDSHVILKEGYTLNINSMTDPQIDDGAKGYSVTFQLKPVPHEQIIS